MKYRKILIVEDEQIIAENLRFILLEYNYKNIDIAIDSAEAIQLFEKTSYDLVLMDINLGDFSAIDGIDLIKTLKKKHSFVFIYITANADKQTVEKATTTKPFCYIVKPFIKTSIYANVTMALNSLKKEKFFSSSQKGMQHKIAISKIIYIKADGSYINITTLKDKNHFVRKSLTEFNELYPNIFIRIHKSILINKNYIQAHTSQIVKINNEKLPIGRTYKQNFLNQIKNLNFHP